MREIALLDKRFREFIHEDLIRERVTGIAEDINRDLAGRDVVFISILNGAFIFSSDLFRLISLNARISFVKASSYAGTRSTGNVKELIGLNEDISNKHIVILDDIIDTGKTIEAIMEMVIEKDPASVRVAALLLKPEAFVSRIKISYTGFEIPNDFVVGYGLDYEGYGRNLTSIYKLIK